MYNVSEASNLLEFETHNFDFEKYINFYLTRDVLGPKLHVHFKWSSRENELSPMSCILFMSNMTSTVLVTAGHVLTS